LPNTGSNSQTIYFLQNFPHHESPNPRPHTLLDCNVWEITDLLCWIEMLATLPNIAEVPPPLIFYSSKF